MQQSRQPGPLSGNAIAGVLCLGTLLVVLTLMFLGSQVSGILSTVGASVGGPYDGGYGEPGPIGGDGSGSDGSGSTGAGGSAGQAGQGVVLAVPRDDLLVIKTGEITIQVADVAPAIVTATERIAALGGYASGSKRSGTGRDILAAVTFRIPSAQWDAALNAVRATGEVLDEETVTEDVTTRVVDLGARIRNLQVTERALQSIMDRATVVKDVLSIQQELTDTRGEIERLTAEKAHLEEQAAFSTLAAAFVLRPEPAVVVAQTSGFDPAREVDSATAKLIRAMQRVATAGIWLGIVWLPILAAVAIAALIAFVVGRRVVRWVARRQAIDWVDVRGGAGE